MNHNFLTEGFPNAHFARREPDLNSLASLSQYGQLSPTAVPFTICWDAATADVTTEALFLYH